MGIVVVGGDVDVAECVDGVEVVSEIVGDFTVVVDFQHGGVVFVAFEVAEGEAGDVGGAGDGDGLCCGGVQCRFSFEGGGVDVRSDGFGCGAIIARMFVGGVGLR